MPEKKCILFFIQMKKGALNAPFLQKSRISKQITLYFIAYTENDSWLKPTLLHKMCKWVEHKFHSFIFAT